MIIKLYVLIPILDMKSDPIFPGNFYYFLLAQSILRLMVEINASEFVIF